MITWVFFGQDGVRAYTRDESGANLPPEFAPWNRFKIFEVPGDNDEELAIRASIIDHGYHLFEKSPNA